MKTGVWLSLEVSIYILHCPQGTLKKDRYVKTELESSYAEELFSKSAGKDLSQANNVLTFTMVNENRDGLNKCNKCIFTLYFSCTILLITIYSKSIQTCKFSKFFQDLILGPYKTHNFYKSVRNLL